MAELQFVSAHGMVFCITEADGRRQAKEYMREHGIDKLPVLTHGGNFMPTPVIYFDSAPEVPEVVWEKIREPNFYGERGRCGDREVVIYRCCYDEWAVSGEIAGCTISVTSVEELNKYRRLSHTEAKKTARDILTGKVAPSTWPRQNSSTDQSSVKEQK